MKTIFKKILIFSLLAIVAFFVAVTAYAWLSRDKIKNLIEEEVNMHLVRPIQIGKISISPFRNFPNINITIHDIIIPKSDSNATIPLISIEKIYFVFDLIEMLKGKRILKKVEIENGTAHLRINKNGERDFDIFKKDTTLSYSEKVTDTTGLKAKNIIVRNFDIQFINEEKEQKVHFIINETHNSFKTDSIHIKTSIEGIVQVDEVSMSSGSFFAHKTIKPSLDLVYEKKSRLLLLKPSQLFIDTDQYEADGMLDMADENMMNLEIHSIKVNMMSAIRNLPKAVYANFDSLDSKGDLHLHACLSGKLKRGERTSVNIDFNTDNTVITRKGKISKIDSLSFSGYFSGGERKGEGILHIKNIKGLIGEEYFYAQMMLNLSHDPDMKISMRSDFEASHLADLLSLKVIKKINGHVNADIAIMGKLRNFNIHADTLPEVIGNIGLDKVYLKLKTLNFPFDELSGNIHWDNREAVSEDLKAKIGKSDFSMKLHTRNILALILDGKDTVDIQSQLISGKIDLYDFVQITNKHKNDTDQKNNENSFLPSNTTLTLTGYLNDFHYKKILAKNIRINLQASSKKLKITQSSRAMNGNTKGMAVMTISGKNKIKMQSRIQLENIDVKKLFSSCDNFNQALLTDANIDGKLTTTIVLEINFDKQFKPDMPGLVSHIDFKLTKGSLTDFEPLSKMSMFLFKSRDFDHVTFQDIRSSMDIKGNLLKIARTVIITNVGYFQGYGTYTIGKYLEAWMRVPVKNLKRKYNAKEINPYDKEGLSIPVTLKGPPKGIKIQLGTK